LDPKIGELPMSFKASTHFIQNLRKSCYKDYRVILVADQASWHKSASIKKDDHLRFIFLPPASPELNPAEHLWDHVREKYFANRTFDSIDDMEIKLERAFHDVYLDKDTIRSLTSFSWLM
jgi:transposase